MTFHHTPTNLPLENEYPKLVRDKIPEIIKQNENIEVAIRLLNDDEFLQYLLRKVVEEAQELSHAESDANLKEEIADVREIIDTLIKLKDFSESELMTLQSEKRKKRGGFDKRLLMLGKDPVDKVSWLELLAFI